MSVIGVPPPSPEQLRHARRATLGALPGDAREGLGWLRRGYLATSPYLPLGIRRVLLRAAGVEIGKLVYGLIRCYFGTGNVEIGNGSFVNMECWFEGAGRIVLGENTMLGPQVMILTSGHAIGESGEISRTPQWTGVTIDDGCWIGARAMILPGVHIGSGTVIAAGALVTSDCEAGGVYAGVPARRLK